METELKALRTEYNKTFDNADGTKTLEAAPLPVHYNNKKGFGDGTKGWRGVDTTLQWDESIKFWYFQYASFAPFIPEYADQWCSFRDLHKEKDQTISFRARCEHVKGVVVDNLPGITQHQAVVYTDAFGKGVDLVYTFDNTRLLKLVRIRENPKTDVSYDFSFKAEGMEVYRTKNKTDEYKVDTNLDKTFNSGRHTRLRTKNGDTILQTFKVWDDNGMETIPVSLTTDTEGMYLTKTIRKEFLEKAEGVVWTDIVSTIDTESNFTCLSSRYESNIDFDNAFDNAQKGTAHANTFKYGFYRVGAEITDLSVNENLNPYRVVIHRLNCSFDSRGIGEHDVIQSANILTTGDADNSSFEADSDTLGIGIGRSKNHPTNALNGFWLHFKNIFREHIISVPVDCTEDLITSLPTTRVVREGYTKLGLAGRYDAEWVDEDTSTAPPEGNYYYSIPTVRLKVTYYRGKLLAETINVADSQTIRTTKGVIEHAIIVSDKVTKATKEVLAEGVRVIQRLGIKKNLHRTLAEVVKVSATFSRKIVKILTEQVNVATKTKAQREIKEQRTERSKVFVRSNKLRTLKASTAALHYDNSRAVGDGELGFREIDHTLHYREGVSGIEGAPDVEPGWYFQYHNFEPFLPLMSDGWAEYTDYYQGKNQKIKVKPVTGTPTQGVHYPNGIEGVTTYPAILYENGIRDGIDLIYTFDQHRFIKLARITGHDNLEIGIRFKFDFGEATLHRSNGEREYELDPDSNTIILRDTGYHTIVRTDEGDTILEPPEVWAEGVENQRIDIGINQQDDAVYLTKIIPAEFLQNAVGDVFTDLTVNYGALDNKDTIRSQVHGNTTVDTAWSSCKLGSQLQINPGGANIIGDHTLLREDNTYSVYISRTHLSFDTTAINNADYISYVDGRINGLIKLFDVGANQSMVCRKSLGPDTADIENSVSYFNNLINGAAVISHNQSANTTNFPFCTGAIDRILNSINKGGYTKYALVGYRDNENITPPPAVDTESIFYGQRSQQVIATLEVTFAIQQQLTEAINVHDTITKHKIKQLKEYIALTSTITWQWLKHLTDMVFVADSVVKNITMKTIAEVVKVYSIKFKKLIKDNMKEYVALIDGNVIRMLTHRQVLQDAVKVYSSIRRTSASFVRTLTEKINVRERFVVLLNGLNAFWTGIFGPREDDDWTDSHPKY